MNLKPVAVIVVVVIVAVGASAVYLLANSGAGSKTASTTTMTTGALTTGTQVSTTAYTIDVAYKPGIGYFLTDGAGLTLYYRSTDKPFSGTTTCNTEACEMNWPVFYRNTLTLPAALNASSFDTITAYNNTKITTYDGYPLFYWAHDAKAGDTTGQGVGDFFAATVPLPATTVTTSTTSSTTLASTSPQIAAVMIPAGTSTNKSSLGNLGYYPNSITVVIGINNTIAWTNDDIVTHTVVSLSVPSGAQPFTDENLNPGSSFSVTLTVPGTYKYHCTIHPWMMGTIVVLADSPSTTTTTSYVYSY